MTPESFVPSSSPSTVRHALKFGSSKINLHQQGKEFEPKATTALPGTADLCFLVQEGTDLEEVIRGFKKDGVQVLEGEQVVKRTGAQGPIRSVYVRDPDGNLVE
jgi:catechol 2,3-dioxygenase-like lactoylglutathione lyase family enzyme